MQENSYSYLRHWPPTQRAWFEAAKVTSEFLTVLFGSSSLGPRLQLELLQINATEAKALEEVLRIIETMLLQATQGLFLVKHNIDLGTGVARDAFRAAKKTIGTVSTPRLETPLEMLLAYNAVATCLRELRQRKIVSHQSLIAGNGIIDVLAELSKPAKALQPSQIPSYWLFPSNVEDEYTRITGFRRSVRTLLLGSEIASDTTKVVPLWHFLELFSQGDHFGNLTGKTSKPPDDSIEQRIESMPRLTRQQIDLANGVSGQYYGTSSDSGDLDAFIASF